MITSNTAKSGRFIRIRKCVFPLLAFLLVGVGFVIATVYNRFETLNLSLQTAKNEKINLEEAKADTEAILLQKETIISDLLVSIEEKEEQLNALESQALEIYAQLESLEAIKDSIYEKLSTAPGDIFTPEYDNESAQDATEPGTIDVSSDVSTSDAAGIVPHDVYVSMASLDSTGSSADSNGNTYKNFVTQYEDLVAKFSEITSSIESTYADLSELSTMTEAYIPYANSIPSGYPIKNSHITSYFGFRTDPVTGKKNSFHYGVDFAAAYRQPIYSTAPGTVVFSGYSTDYGYNIIIDHGYGYRTRYAHLSKLYVKKGATVERGDLIAGAGSTGKSTAVHLHYEVHLNGERLDPTNFLK